jgi:hypothetical protein
MSAFRILVADNHPIFLLLSSLDTEVSRRMGGLGRGR